MAIRHDAKELVEFLDSLAKIDPVAMGALIAARVPHGPALQDHPTVQVGDGVVGLLGIMNGYAGVYDDGPKKGFGPITAVVESDGRVSGFHLTA